MKKQQQQLNETRIHLYVVSNFRYIIFPVYFSFAISNLLTVWGVEGASNKHSYHKEYEIKTTNLLNDKCLLLRANYNFFLL